LTALVAALLLVLWHPVARGEQKLQIAHGDDPLVIHATFDPKTTSFSGLFTLTMRGGPAPETLSVQREDLVDPKQETIRIERANVAVPDGVSLVNDASREVRVTVSNVTRRGNFGGKLILSCTGHPNVRTELQLLVKARARPELRSVSPSVSYSLLRCRWPFCRVWDLLVPPLLRGAGRDALVQNLGSDPVTLGPTLLTLRGDKTGSWPRVGGSQAELQLSGPKTGTVDGWSTAALRMTTDRRALLPDHYQGNLVVKIAGSDDPTTVGVTLDVRDGPGAALAAIVVGILIGRLLQRMATPAAQARHRLFELHRQVGDVAAWVTEPVSATFLARHLDAERPRIVEASAAEEKEITDRLEVLRKQAFFLFDLQSLDALARRGVVGDDLENLTGKLRNARDYAISGKLPEATALRDEVDAALATHGGAASDALALRGQRQPAVADAPEGKGEPASVLRRRSSAVLKCLAGSFAREEANDYPIVRPLIHALLLGVLVLIGLQTLYITSGTTFGSAGIYDYLGLFLWGLSADVAQATLQNLPRRV